MHPMLDALLFLLRLPFWFLASWVEFLYRLARPKRKSVRGQVAIVTGAGAGIGQLICLRLARLGCHIAAWDVNPQGLESTKSLVAAEANAGQSPRGVRFETFVCDVASRESCYSTARATLARMGRVDLAVMNAGIVHGRSLLDADDAQIEKVFQVNLLSHFWITKALLPHMLERGDGHLFYTASVAAWIGASRLADYCASKAADLIFAESLESELRSCHPTARIPVTTLCPYLIRTGMFLGCQSHLEALLPTLDPADVADRAVQAILAEESVVAIPRAVYLFLALKSVLPKAAYVALLKVANIDKFMGSFQGSLSALGAAGDGRKTK